MRIQKARQIEIVFDLPPWALLPWLDREALRRLELKDRSKTMSVCCAHDTFTPQPVVE